MDRAFGNQVLYNILQGPGYMSIGDGNTAELPVIESWRTALDKFRILLWAPGDEMRELGDALQTTFAHIVQGNRITQADPRDQKPPPQ
jgi:hypothetical protein